MNDEFEDLNRALSDLRDVHRATSAPAGLEARLRAAVLPARRRWYYGVAVGMAAALALAVFLVRAPGDRELPEFVTVPSGEFLPAPAATAVLRLKLRRADLREYGFQVDPAVASEVIDADFMVGDDGLARAVRVSLR